MDKERLQTTHMYEIYIQATAQAIWDAITKPEWTARYGYRGPAHYDLRPGGRYHAAPSKEMMEFGLPDVVIDGEVLEASAPHKLVHTYRMLFSEENRKEGFTRITWEISETQSGFCRLTVTHELEDAPVMAAMVDSSFSETGTGGWKWVLSDLKSLLETGHAMGE